MKPSWSVENQGKSEMKGGYTDNGTPLSSMVVTGRLTSLQVQQEVTEGIKQEKIIILGYSHLYSKRN